MDFSFILRLLTLVLLVIWRAYWFLTTKEAAIKKPKTDNNPRINEQIFANILTGYILINLFGFVILPFNNISVQTIGFILVLLGFVEGIVARKILDDNWTNSNEYQIKKNHELITNGIYKYVRHPIYGGLLLMVPGVLLVAGSYTFIAGLILMFIVFQALARREEKILSKHFGTKYTQYMKTTKKFIPFIY